MILDFRSDETNLRAKPRTSLKRDLPIGTTNLHPSTLRAAELIADTVPV